MRIEFLESFVEKLDKQLAYIAQDKPFAARKFKSELFQQIKLLAAHPFLHKKSIYFNREDVRDMTFKGYTIVYKVDEKENLISVFAFLKFESGIQP